MTEETRQIQLANQIWFPLFCGPSNMNAYTIFFQNSFLVDDRHETAHYTTNKINGMLALKDVDD